jgi:hypothetical protein
MLLVLAKRAHPHRLFNFDLPNIAGILTLAAAPDFTEYIWNDVLTKQQQRQMQEIGHVDLPSRYQKDEPYRYSYQFILDGREHCILSSSKNDNNKSISDDEPSSNTLSLPNDIPIVLVHGTGDEDIPYSFSERLFQECCGGCATSQKNKNSKNNKNIHLHLVAGGDHRLSDDSHLDGITMYLDFIVRHIRRGHNDNNKNV